MGLKGASVGVVGGGVAGLMFAICAQSRGAQVTVFEQAPEIGEFGAGLQLSKNALRVFSALKLHPDAEIPLSFPKKLHIYDIRTGMRLMSSDQNRSDEKVYAQVHRADLVGFLSAMARRLGVKVNLAARAKAGPGTIDTGEQAQSFDHVVIASGVRSVAHTSAAPRFDGKVAWRATIPGTVSKAQTRVWIGPRRHLVAYPLRHGKLTNIVAVENSVTWDQEGWNHEGDPDLLRAAFSPACAEVADMLAQVTQTRRWALYTHPDISMVSCDGLPLVGDAAQTMLPFMAQGAAMAIEDAWALASAIDQGAGLDRWAALRAARRNKVSEMAQANGRIFHEARPWALPFHRLGMWGLGRVWPNFGAARLRVVYDYDVTADFP